MQAASQNTSVIVTNEPTIIPPILSLQFCALFTSHLFTSQLSTP